MSSRPNALELEDTGRRPAAIGGAGVGGSMKGFGHQSSAPKLGPALTTTSLNPIAFSRNIHSFINIHPHRSIFAFDPDRLKLTQNEQKWRFRSYR